ncbi:MAG: 4Fe-4S binding protein [bacterium]
MRRQRLRKTILGISFFLFQYFLMIHLLLSPVLIVYGAAHGVIQGSFIIYVLIFLSSLFLGRAFCGWMCPGAGLQELCCLIVKKKAAGRPFYCLKYIVFGIWSAAILYAVIQAGGYHRIDFYFGMNSASPARNGILFFGVFAVIVPAAFIGGKWATCHYVCWIAPLMILGARIKEHAFWPSLRLRTQPDCCAACGVCDDHCPMSLEVSTMVRSGAMDDPECILCGTCVDACPSDSIRFSFRAR